MNRLVILAQPVLMVWALLAQLDVATSAGNNLVVRGQLVCLASDLKESSCDGGPARLAIKTSRGVLFPLVAGESADTLLQEKRLKTREFRLVLRAMEGSKAFEIIKSQLVRDGRVYDFHYFCEICNITTYAPGPCMCCRAPTDYREVPAKSPQSNSE